MNPSSAERERSPVRLLLNIEEVANLLGVKRTFIFGLIASGRIPSLKLGRLRKIARADVEAFVESLRAQIHTEDPGDGDPGRRSRAS